MNRNNYERRCKALAKSGKPCRAPSTAGGLCFIHANPNNATELGRIGGGKNRRCIADNFDPHPKGDSALSVQEATAQVIADIHAGKLDRRVGKSLVPLLNLMLRALEAAEVEKRFETVNTANKLLAVVDKARGTASDVRSIASVSDSGKANGLNGG
jgi:hypothetical protein